MKSAKGLVLGIFAFCIGHELCSCVFGGAKLPLFTQSPVEEEAVKTPGEASERRESEHIDLVIAHCGGALDWIDAFMTRPLSNVSILSMCGQPVNGKVAQHPRTKTTVLDNNGYHHAFAHWLASQGKHMPADRHEDDLILFTSDRYLRNITVPLRDMIDAAQGHRFACGRRQMRIPGEPTTPHFVQELMGAFSLQQYNNTARERIKSKYQTMKQWMQDMGIGSFLKDRTVVPVCFGDIFLTTYSQIFGPVAGIWEHLRSSLSANGEMEKDFAERSWAALLSVPMVPEEEVQVLASVKGVPAENKSWWMGLICERGCPVVRYPWSPPHLPTCWAQMAHLRKELQLQDPALQLLWEQRLGRARRAGAHRTLVIYSGPVTVDTRKAKVAMYMRNFRYFLKYATCPDALVEILVVVGRSVNTAAFQPGMDIGGKVTWLRRGPNCYDFEAYRIGLRYIGAENLKRYDRFVLLNCGIGGPFLPEEAMTSRIHWSRFFTSRVTEKVKLVGITMSNQAATPAFVGQRYNHVQSMLWATDLSGLQVILRHLEQNVNINFFARDEPSDLNATLKVWPATTVKCRTADPKKGEFVELGLEDFVNSAEVNTSQRLFDKGFFISAIARSDQRLELSRTDARLVHGDPWPPAKVSKLSVFTQKVFSNYVHRRQ
ncbi:unnamed protein product [Symbiodinium sp. CCMP2592]|nr:unnamed protein product [Symbiodinium sp. CCMP2592]